MHGTAREPNFRQTLNPATLSPMELARKNMTLFGGSGLMQGETSFRKLLGFGWERLELALPKSSVRNLRDGSGEMFLYLGDSGIRRKLKHSIS